MPAGPAPGPAEHAPRGLVWLLAGATLLGLALRTLAASDELWLDEIWSLSLVSELDGPLAIFTSLHSDNNHYLNSLVLYALGTQEWPLSYRVLPVLAASSSIVLAGIWGARRSVRCGVIAALFTAVSFPFVQYGSEARGYAYLLPAMIGFVIALERFLEKPSWRRGLLLNLIAILGVLSHLSFVFLWVPCALWAFLAAWRRAGLRAALRVGAVGFALAGLALVALYVLDVQHMNLFGGPVRSLAMTLVQALALVFGMPSRGAGRILLAAGTLALLAAMLAASGFRRRETHLLVPLFVGAAVAIALMVSNEEYATPRYLLVPITLSILLLASWVAERLGESGTSRWLGIVVSAVFVLGNLSADGELIRTGRGDYSAALARIAQSGDTGIVSLGSDQDFRAELMIGFYAPPLERSGELRFRLQRLDQGRPPNWLIRQQLAPGLPPLPAQVEVLGARYRQIARYPHAGLSGMTWTIFRRE